MRKVEDRFKEAAPEGHRLGREHALTEGRLKSRSTLLLEALLLLPPCLHQCEELAPAEVDQVELLDPRGHGVDAQSQEHGLPEVPEASHDELDRFGDTASDGGEIGTATVRSHDLDVETYAPAHGRERSVGEVEDLDPVLEPQRQLDLQIPSAPSGRDDEIEVVVDVLWSAVLRATVFDSELCEAI